MERDAHLGFFLRRERALATLGARLLARRLGRLRRVDLVYEHHGLRRGWLADWPAHLDPARMGHGAFGDLAGHLIDLCHETVGPLRPVRCALRRTPGAAADSGGEALLRTAGGASLDEAIAANRTLDALRAVASISPTRRPRSPSTHGPDRAV